MTTVAALPASPQAIVDADLLVIDQVVSAVLTTYKVTALKARQYVVANAGVSAGMVASNGTSLEATTLAGNLAFTQAGATGTLTSPAPIQGTGITVSNAGGTSTITNAGVLSFGAATGAIVLGANLSMTGQTLEVAEPLAAIAAGDFLANTTTASAAPTATALATLTAGTGLSGGPFTAATGGTLSVAAATTAALGSVISGSGTTIDAGGTLSVAVGAGGVSSLGGATGSITVSTGLSESFGNLTVKHATTATLGGIIVGSGLAVDAGATLSLTTTPTFASEIVTGTISSGPLLELLDSSSAGSVTAVSGTAMQIVGANSTSTGFDIVNVGSSGSAPSLYMRAATGTRASPAAVANNQQLGLLNVRGHDGTTWLTGNVGQMAFNATENWTYTAHGTNFVLTVTAAGGVTTKKYTFAEGNLSVPGNVVANSVTLGGGSVTSVVAGTGMTAGTITAAGTLAVAAATTAALGGIIVGGYLTVSSGTVAVEAALSVQTLPFSFLGPLANAQQYNVCLTQAGTLLANGGTPQGYIPVNPTATQTLVLKTIHSGTLTTQGTISVNTGGTITWPTFTAVAMVAGDSVQLLNQATADATFANACLSLQFQKT